MASTPRPMRAAATRQRAASLESESELDDPKRQDEIRYPKPKKVKIHDGAIEIHELPARAQRSFTGFAIRLTGDARRSGIDFSATCSGLLASFRYCSEFIPFIVAAMHPADQKVDDKQFEALCRELDERLGGPMAAVDLTSIFAHMCEQYDIAKVIENLPKI